MSKDKFWPNLLKKQAEEETKNVGNKTAVAVPVLDASPKSKSNFGVIGMDSEFTPITASSSKRGTVDVPIDLGDGYVVVVKGLPGTPSVAACQRICRIIMAYAPLPPQAPQAAINTVKTAMTEEKING